MRVLHVIPAISPRYGGPSNSVIETCSSLIRLGVAAEIATTNADGKRMLDSPCGVWTDFQGVPTIFFRKSASEAFKFSRGLQSWLDENVSQYDLVHIHAVFSHSTLAAGYACLRKNVPYIVRPLGSLDPWSLKKRWVLKRMLLKSVVGTVLSGAQAIQFTSELERNSASSLVVGGNCVVVPNGVSTMGGVDKKDEPGDYVLYMGRIHGKKKLPLLVESFSRATQKHSGNVKLVIAGDGDATELAGLKKLGEDLGLEDRLQFCGWVDGETKRDLIIGARLMVLLSNNENFGIAIVEALAAGTPVLIDIGVYIYPEIEAFNAGWVARNDGEVPDLIKKALSDPQECRNRADRGKTLYGREFASEVVAHKMLALYSNILGE